jgi:hypothetical protein
MSEPRGDIETRIMRRLVHLDMTDLNCVNELLTTLSSSERIKPDKRAAISEKLVTLVQEIKQLINGQSLGSVAKVKKSKNNSDHSYRYFQ